MEITPKLSVTEDKIRLLTVKTDMFKTACLTLNVLVPMGEYAAEYAVLSSYLVHSSKKYDSLIKLNSRLEELYGALLSGSISRHGENYRIQLSITCIDDSLTFDGASVTGASLELLLSLLTKPSADENGFSPEQLQWMSSVPNLFSPQYLRGIGEIILRTPGRRAVFLAGLIGAALLAVALAVV